MAAGKEVVLAYNFRDSKRGRTLKLICMQLGIRVKAVEPALYGLPLEQLIEWKDVDAVKPAYTGEGFSEEMLVMCGLGSGRMDQLLMLLRKHKLLVPYKAVMTVHNRGWDSCQLFGEICKEHQAVTGKQNKISENNKI